jgi:hypothetical protein
MKRYFYNEAEGRLRAGWRIALFFLALGVIGNAIIFAIQALLGGRPEPGLGRDFMMIGTLAVVMTVLLPFGRRILDKRSTLTLGLRLDSLAIKDLVFGWLLSGAMAAVFFVLLRAGGFLTIESFAWTGNAFLLPLSGYFVLHVLVGWWEELFFRGYLFDNLVAGMGTVLAIVVSCVLYGVVHMINPNASLLSGTIIVLFGWLRLYGLLSTKQLWLSMGMHMGWNFFQGPVFGFGASGHETIHLIEHTLNGPAWLTGGEFGPEASIITIPIVLMALGVMRLWSRRVQPHLRTVEP